MPDELVKLLHDADPSLLVTPCGRGQIDAFTKAASTMLRDVYGVEVETGTMIDTEHLGSFFELLPTRCGRL